MSNPKVYSAFLSKYICVYQDNVDNPKFAKYILDQQGEDSIRYNVLYDIPFNMSLDASLTQALSIPGLLVTDRVMILAEIDGEGYIKVDGYDTDGSTPISGYLRGVGNSTFPAKIYYGGKSVTGVTLGSISDNTIISGHILVVCAATDPRYS